jgi:hypothetical protein
MLDVAMCTTPTATTTTATNSLLFVVEEEERQHHVACERKSRVLPRQKLPNVSLVLFREPPRGGQSHLAEPLKKKMKMKKKKVGLFGGDLW